MTESSKYCSDVMKKLFEELVMTKKGNGDYKNSTKFLICDNDILIMMLK